MGKVSLFWAETPWYWKLITIYVFVSFISFLLISLRPKGKRVQNDIFQFIKHEFPISILYVFFMIVLLPTTVPTTVQMIYQERIRKKDENNSK